MQQYIDAYAILETTEGAPRDKAMRLREELIHLLRVLEDMHGLPRSIPSKVERGEAPPKTGHHNR